MTGKKSYGKTQCCKANPSPLDPTGERSLAGHAHVSVDTGKELFMRTAETYS
uniref:Uncharacterized protein n=1 Tax=Arion vulgaris TaxID=1028688 RepID=A0A0B6ZPL1_9EUPU